VRQADLTVSFLNLSNLTISILGVCVSKGVSVGYMKVDDCWKPALEDICKEAPFPAVEH